MTLPSSRTSNLMLLAGTLLGLFFLLELGARLLIYSRTPTQMIFRDDIIYSYQPNSAPGGVVLNNVGCIGDYVAAERGENEVRVLMLGGSTSFSKAYVDAVDSEISGGMPSRKVTSFSCGRPRYTSYINRVNYENNLAAYEPDAVIIYLGINDNIYNAFPRVAELPQIGFFNWRAANSSVFYQVLKYYLIDKIFFSNPQFYDQPALRSSDILARNTEQLIEEARSGGAVVVLGQFAVSSPTEDAELALRHEQDAKVMEHFWGSLRSTVYGVHQHNRVLAEISSKMDIPFVRLDSLIPKDSAHYVDICHFTPLGAEMQGRALGRAVLAALRGKIELSNVPIKREETNSSGAP